VPHVRQSVRGPKMMGAANDRFSRIDWQIHVSRPRSIRHSPTDPFQRLNGVYGQLSKSNRWAAPVFSAQVRWGEPGAPRPFLLTLL